MKGENSETSESHRFRLDLTDKRDLKDPKKNMVLANLSINYTWKNIKSDYNKNKFNQLRMILLIYLMVLTDIQDYFEFIIKKHETLTQKPASTNLSKFTQKQNCFQKKNRLQIVDPRSNETVRKRKKKALTKIKTVKTCQN